MALTLVILAEGPSSDLVAHMGPQAYQLYGQLLADTALVATRLAGAQVVIRHSPTAHRAIFAALPAEVACEAAPVEGSAAVAAAVRSGLAAGGPTLLIGGALPHLPLWRLRDAATHLADGAELVIGPSDRGSWYLLGLRAPDEGLIGRLPAPGASIQALARERHSGHVQHMLPPWFGIRTVGDLVALAETLHSMPDEVAPHTRALLEVGQASRAVGG